MARLRVVSVLLALGLAVPGVLLVRQALDGVAIEQAARHRAVAERVFDEMERTLSVFLQKEEERPVGHYRHFWSPAGSPPGVRLRSPLADPSPEVFVVGYFEVDARGNVRTPLLPRPGEVPDGALALSPDAEAAADRVLALARRAWPTGSPRPSTASKQAPGTTVAVGRAAKKDSELQEKLRADPPLADAYDALQSLNRGAALRQKRMQKVIAPADADMSRQLLADFESAPAEEVFAAAPPPSGRAGGLAAPSAMRMEQGMFEEEDAIREARVEAKPVRPASRPPALASSISGKRSNASMPLIVDPMLGFRLADAYLVLHRTVWQDQRALRQGLILDTVALEPTLFESALPRLPNVTAQLVDPAAPPPTAAPAVFPYRHRFAEPFDGLAVDLTLPALAGGSGARSIYGLSLALVLAGSVGLFALYRMVSVVVRFSERRSNFVAAVSHELKTPLTAIRMYSEMLRDGMVPDEEKRHEYYTTITAESERLSRLIDNVLEFSRLGRGTREMRWVVGDLGPVVREAGDVLGPHAAAQGFRLEIEIAEDLPAVRFDRDAILQVLFNLVDNALKYARDATQKTVHLIVDRDGDQVVVTVRDHGPGVPAASQKRIFEPFHREQSELTRRAQGTGIGLSLVKGLAEQMGAALRVRNAEGGGFAVGLAFPVS